MTEEMRQALVISFEELLKRSDSSKMEVRTVDFQLLVDYTPYEHY